MSTEPRLPAVVIGRSSKWCRINARAGLCSPIVGSVNLPLPGCPAVGLFIELEANDMRGSVMGYLLWGVKWAAGLQSASW